MSRREEHMTDPELVEACLGGSESAWATLVDRYSRLVYSIPARQRLAEHLRDDVYQSVWAIAVRHLGGLRDAQSLAAWLIRTTQRETWRIGRAASGSSPAGSTEDLVWTDPAEADLLEDRQRMRAALGRLDERCRELLIAAFSADRPNYDQLAERLGMPRGSIGPNRGRCLNKLRTLIEKNSDVRG